MNSRRGPFFLSHRFWTRILLAGVAVAGLVLLPAGEQVTLAEQGGGSAPVGKYIGAGSCAASSCHGSVRPRNETRIQQNEYSTWVTQDRHATHAYRILTEPVSQRIARILKLSKPAHEDPKCLVCHALHVSPDQRNRPFDVSEGVSCENCHGPASGWLGGHTAKDRPHQENVREGMFDTKNLITRTEKCLACHLGGIEPNKFVDHEMIAAGHPDLVFELDSFSAVMPRHWKEPYDKDAWLGARSWSTGQAVQLRESMNRLIGRAKGKVWPEYGELDCFACHHALTRPEESWRLLEDGYYTGRRVGDPGWNRSRFAVFRYMLAGVDSNAAGQLDAEVGKLSAEMSKLVPDRDAVVASATRVRDLSDGLARRLSTMNYDAPSALRWMKAIAGNGDDIAMHGARVAEQATMAIDSLYIAYTRNGGSAGEARAAINGLFTILENPSAYDARRFAEQMRRVNASLR
jgi:hypothetical protein